MSHVRMDSQVLLYILHHAMCQCVMWVRKWNIGSLGIDFEGILEVGCCLVPTVQRHVGQQSMPKYDSAEENESVGQNQNGEEERHSER